MEGIKSTSHPCSRWEEGGGGENVIISPMNVTVDEEKCIGCGACAEICPAVFYLDEDEGVSKVIDPFACEYAGCCEAAEENCPAGAITVTED